MATSPNLVVQVHILETERLRLRGHRVEDFAHSAAMWADPVVARFVGGKPLSEEETWAKLLRYVGHWSLLGFGYWLVEEKATGEFVGEVGFANYKRDVQPSLEGMPEAGWVLAREAHGKGYATEALRAVLGWGEMRFGKTRTACMIHPENAASIRVAEKCGYREPKLASYKGESVLLFMREPGK